MEISGYLLAPTQITHQTTSPFFLEIIQQVRIYFTLLWSQNHNESLRNL